MPIAKIVPGIFRKQMKTRQGFQSGRDLEKLMPQKSTIHIENNSLSDRVEAD